jgi:para-aminobenzoate synthetase component 1
LIDRSDAPVVHELSPLPDPARCCETLAGYPYRVFLDSAARGARLGRYSFVAADPIAVVRSKGSRTECIDCLSGERRESSRDALAVLRELLLPHRTAAVPLLPPLQGGAIGFVSYDWGRTLERVPACRFDDLALPDVLFGVYDWVLAWDHQTSRAWLISTGMPEGGDAGRRTRARVRANAVLERLNGGRPTTAAPVADEPMAAASVAPSYPVEDRWGATGLDVRSSFTHNGYRHAVERVREYIFTGDIYQANLSQRFEAPLYGTPWDFYLRLRARNAAPFAAFLDFAEAVVLSASPERFLQADAAGHVETRPIKGTRPRGLGPEHDGALGLVLAESPKDRAENLMIVDLMRNDLSRVCAPGTVRVSELFALERYATVQHLVSTVVGTIAPERDTFDMIRAAFPGGSITGVPKIRAMEIIAELEPSQRGVYCGSIGYWSLTGWFDSSIAIRTAVARRGRLYFNAGGGIVADSDAEQEYRETLDKAQGMVDALALSTDVR